MRRRSPIALLALLLVAAGPPRTIDLAKRGVPFADPARNVQVIQSAIDELGDSLKGNASGVVLLPDDDVPVDRPIFLDRNGVGLEGKGKGVSRLVATSGHDILTLIRRRPVTPDPVPPPSADHFPAGLAGHVAFRTKADAHLAQQGGPLDTFPAGVTALTVDLAVDLTHLNDPGGSYARGKSASLCGLTDRSASSPWEMVLANGSYVFRMQSAAGTIVQCQFGSVGEKPGVVRMTVQTDLAAGKVATWVDDRPVPNDAKLPADFTAFAANQHCPFGVGSNAANANNVADWFGGASDITFLGLRVSRAALYKPDAPLTYLSSRVAIADNRYWAIEPSTMGALALNERPADVAASRVMTVIGPGYAATTAYLLDNAGHLSNYATVAPGPIRHLSLVSRSKFGRGIAVGYTLFLRVEDCEVFGGRDGIASINFGATYPATIRDCDLSGSDSPLYLYSTASATVERITIPGGFRCGVRLVDSVATVRNVFAPCWGTQDHYVRAVRSSFAMEDCAWDNEGNQGAQVAPIYIAPGGVYPILCRVSRCGFATYAKDAPLALLDNAPADFPHALKFAIEDCADAIRGGGRIEARGGRWKVTSDIPPR